MGLKALLVGSAILVGGYFLLGAGGRGGGFEERFVAACEAEIASRLAAASSYQRKSMSAVHVQPATWVDSQGLQFTERALDYAQSNEAPNIKALHDEMEKVFAMHEVSVLYEVTLRYSGETALLDKPRAASVCTLTVHTEDVDAIKEDKIARDLRVDGFDVVGWSIYRMGRSQKLLRALD